MKVLVVGSGGREYAIGQALKEDPQVTALFFAPGNGATGGLGTNIAENAPEALAAFVQNEGIDLTIVGPEAPLVEGIVDTFKAQGLTIFGPTKAAAQLEGSKIFMKNFLARHQIPTARYLETEDVAHAHAFIDTMTPPVVVKADGLCGGKGVIIAGSLQEAKTTASDMLSGDAFGQAGARIVIEEYLDGYELSVFAICDGKDFITLPACQDHKRLLDNDQGPNTGGMGAYCPTPLCDTELMQKIETRVIRPTLDGMAAEGTPFEGVLFCGIMVVKGEPIVLEFNVRFGDPECEELMPLLDTPAASLFFHAARGELGKIDLRFKEQAAVGIVVASRDYPYKSTPPARITVTKTLENARITYAGVTAKEDGLYATGGRVLVVVGLGDTIREARDRAYAQAEMIHFEGMQYRLDIAYQALEG